MDVDESIGRTNATAGQAVVVAGGTVVVAILGLQLAGIPFVAALGYSASIVVAVAVLVAITLLPALLGFAGHRVLARAQPRAPRPSSERGAQRLGALGRTGSPITRGAARSPPPSVLVTLSIPMLDMRLGQADAGTDPDVHHPPSRLRPAGRRVRRRVQRAAAASSSTSATTPTPPCSTGSSPPWRPTPASGRSRRPSSTPPATPGSSPRSRPPSHRTRPPATSSTDSATRPCPPRPPTPAPTALVGGPTAGFIDQSDKIADRLPWFIAAVVSLSFLLLMIVFRSILVPLKAALLNLLSIGAAYGVVVAVFQWGWGRSLIGLDEAVPIASFVPMMMFAILFGLSMDYEVFILSRIREEYHRGHSNIDSVVEGLGATAKVITAAALIMISVFLGFVASDDPVVKMMGVGLATAVAVDATIVRMVLVPVHHGTRRRRQLVAPALARPHPAPPRPRRHSRAGAPTLTRRGTTAALPLCRLG